jgi:hypothetical protein
MHVAKDDIPLVSYPNDEVWIVFRNQPVLAIVWVEALTAGAVVEVSDGPSDDPALQSSPTTLTFTQASIKQLVQLPVSGNPLNNYVRILPTNGQVSLSIAAPSVFRYYMRVQFN